MATTPPTDSAMPPAEAPPAQANSPTSGSVPPK
jgi:hypothetical protein